MQSGRIIESALADCTPPQREAISHMTGPLLVIAGPGIALEPRFRGRHGLHPVTAITLGSQILGGCDIHVTRVTCSSCCDAPYQSHDERDHHETS